MYFTSVLFKKQTLSDNSSEIFITVIAYFGNNVWVHFIIEQHLKLSDLGVHYVYYKKILLNYLFTIYR